jgi:hypothetical protein
MLNLKRKPRFFGLSGVILAIAILTLYTFAAIIGQNQPESKRATQVDPTPLPIADYNTLESSSVEKRNIRRARSSRHNDSTFDVKELPPNVGRLPQNSHSWWGLSSIPTNQSDAVIVGEVNDAHAYLSNDKTGVYSEFTIQVEQVLKAPRGVNPTSIVAERIGGAVRFPSGRVIRYEVYDQGMPRIGGRYLLFLRYNTDGDNFSVFTGYELRNGRVVPLDSIEGLFTEYRDWPEAAFHSLVTTTIKGRQK